MDLSRLSSHRCLGESMPFLGNLEWLIVRCMCSAHMEVFKDLTHLADYRKRPGKLCPEWLL